MNEATAFSNILATFAATYLFHSTLLLMACWLLLRLSRTTSHYLAERLWKLAAIMGLITTVIHMTSGISPMFSLVADQDASLDRDADITIRLDDGGRDHASVNSIEPLNSAERWTESSSTAIQFPSVSTDLMVEPERSTDVADSPGPPVSETTTVEFPSAAAPSIQLAPRADHAVDVGNRYPADNTMAATQRTMSAEEGRPRGQFLGIRLLETRRWKLIASWISTLAAVLMIGGVVSGGVLLVSQSLRLRKRFATSRPLQAGPARQALNRFLKRNKIRRRIRLLASATQHEPVTYGLFAWTIVLPEHTESRLGKEELRALLAHEVAHLVRGDVWWLWIGRLICNCLAFQPLNFLARRKWQQAAEYLCDDWAVERGVRSLSLARCLTQIAEWRFGQQTFNVGLAAGGTKATLIQRVERLVETEKPVDAWTKPLRRRLLVAGAMAIAVALVGLTPRFALPFVPAGQANSQLAAASLGQTYDVERTQDRWHLLQEELLQLDADLAQANRLFHSASRHPEAAAHMIRINRQAAALRARRTYITSLLGKDSQR